jgi:hypothetical protein
MSPSPVGGTLAGSGNGRHPELDTNLLEQLVAATLRRVQIGRVTTAAGRAGSVHIDRIDVGGATVDQVTIQDFAASLHCGSALLRNVRAILELHFKVRWSYDLKWFGSDSGIKTLGSKAKPIPLHDIRLPMLQDIAFEIPEAAVEDIQATVQPVTEVALGGASFEDLAIDDTRLPSDGFGITGLDFGALEIESFSAPAADSRQLTIGRFQPDAPLQLPDVEVRGIALPEVEIPDAGSDGAVSLMDIQPEEFEAPVFKIGDLFKATFIATPVLHLQIGELVLSDLSASASIGAVQIRGVSTPVTVRGVRLGELTLDQLSVDQISI